MNKNLILFFGLLAQLVRAKDYINYYKELRKSWKEIFNNPKDFIKEVNILLG